MIKMGSCPLGKEKDAGLCYHPCKKGYDGVGPVCWPICPEGYPSIGVSCIKPKKDIGVGTIPTYCGERDGVQTDHWGLQCFSKPCPSWTDAEGIKHKGKRTSWLTCDMGPYGGVHTQWKINIDSLQTGEECTAENGVDFGLNDKGKPKCDTKHKFCAEKGKGWFKTAWITCQKQGLVSSAHFGKSEGASKCDPNGVRPDEQWGLCYKKCPEGYGAAGPVCWKKCPNSELFRDDGAYCGKKSYGRGVGTTPTGFLTTLVIIILVIVIIAVLFLILRFTGR